MSLSVPQIAVLLSGAGTNLKAIHQAIGAGHLKAAIALVVSSKAAAPGLIWAKKQGIPVQVVELQSGESRLEYDSRLLASLERQQVDCVVLAGFMRQLSGVMVTPFLGKLINIHPSLLPRYPGLNTHQRALEAQDLEHGCSVHYVIEALDAGPLIGQRRLQVALSTTAEDLKSRVQKLEYELYWRCIQAVVQGDVVFESGRVRWKTEKIALGLGVAPEVK